MRLRVGGVEQGHFSGAVRGFGGGKVEEIMLCGHVM